MKCQSKKILRLVCCTGEGTEVKLLGPVLDLKLDLPFLPAFGWCHYRLTLSYFFHLIPSVIPGPSEYQLLRQVLCLLLLNIPQAPSIALGRLVVLADKHILSCFSVKEVIEGSGGERSGMRADRPANSGLGFLPSVMGSITKFTYQVTLHYRVMLRDIINMENT